jgi:hypothetical protein
MFTFPRYLWNMSNAAIIGYLVKLIWDLVLFAFSDYEILLIQQCLPSKIGNMLKPWQCEEKAEILLLKMFPICNNAKMIMNLMN